ncbi:MAG: endonuclease MutS2 [Blastocatellia bacterium]|nr:endonuclease MutS2 [Blastocatellia bacterium]MDW8256424.1 endonuclease MutS2 [Acidobacteriota bacterium]
MTPLTFESLEYEALLALLAERTQTPQGRRLVEQLRPMTDPEEIRRQLRLVSDAAQYLSAHSGFGLSGLADPTEALQLLRIENATLSPTQILDLIALIEVGQDVRTSVLGQRRQYPHLAAFIAEIPDLRPALRHLRGKILPGGEIDDHASPELAEIRQHIHRLRARIYRRLEEIMRASPEGIVQDELVTLRNERYVIPVRASHRTQVPGVVHAVSSSGATVFIEPLETIELNNELVRWREEEQAEIARILREMSERLRWELPLLEKLARLIAELDVLSAKARLALDFRCVEPELVSDRVTLVLEEARHVLLEHVLRQRGEPIVPISVALDDAHRVLIISGPNAGGKTVAVKTIGLLALMAQSGMLIPARAATLSVFRSILADIGDRQSLVANLSTFTAHITSVREMAEQLQQPALVLIDEVGTGTDPEEGAALAVAIVDYFRRRGAMVVAATHYSALKTYGYLTPGVVNAAVEFDEVRLQPTYRLQQGVAGASSALEIARRVGLPEEILAEARKQLGASEQEANRYLNRLREELEQQRAARMALEEERAALAERYEQLQREFFAREQQRQRQFETMLREFLATVAQRAEELLGQITDEQARRQARRLIERRMAKFKSDVWQRARAVSFETPPTSAPTPHMLPAEEVALKPGDRVRVRSLNQIGVVAEVEPEQVLVHLGPLRVRASVSDLDVLLEPTPETIERPSERVRLQLAARADVPSELNLIGKTVEEALELTDRFLDAAYLADRREVTIIHGAGSGALRRAVREFLSRHPHVARFRPASADGATLVELNER